MTDGPTGHVATFKPRRRPLSAGRAATMARLAPELCLDVDGAPFDAVAEFGRRAPLVLDIGTGAGDALIEAAAHEPHLDVIGADVHTPGIAATLAAIERDGLENVRLVHGDVLRFATRLRDGSLDVIRVYFPDPWPKARHRHRRLISPERLDLFARILRPGGVIHLATDIDDYAAHARAAVRAHAAFDGGDVPRPPDRPTTRYERKGLEAGRTVTDLVFERVAEQ